MCPEPIIPYMCSDRLVNFHSANVKIKQCKTNIRKMGLRDILRSITVEPVTFLSHLASHTQKVVMQNLVYQKVCLFSDYREECNNLTGEGLKYVESESSSWMRYTNMAALLPAIVATLYLGSWCSRYGAKVPLLLPALGCVFSNLINVIVSVYMNTSIVYLILSQFITGIMGGSLSVTMAAMSTISLVSTVENRSMRVGVLESMSFFGSTIGPFLSGFLLAHTNHAVVFLFLLTINVTIVLFVLVLVKNINPNEADDVTVDNSLALTESKSFACKELFGTDHFVGSMTVCFKRREHHTRKIILALLLAMVVTTLASSGETDTTLLFVKDEPLKWQYDELSYYNSLRTGLGALMLFCGMPFLKWMFNPRDTTLGVFGILSRMAGLILLGLSRTTLSVFLVPLVGFMHSYVHPIIRSMLSKMIGPIEVGKTFAFFSCIENVAELGATFIFNSIYPATRSFFHGFVFIFAAVLLFIPLLIMAGLHRMRSREDVLAIPAEDGYSNMS